MAGATNYRIEVYRDQDLNTVEFWKDTTSLSASPDADLSEGEHWWQMQVDRGGGYEKWTPA